MKLEAHIDGKPNIGVWNNPRERVHRLANLPQAGTYVLRGKFAAAAGASRLTLDVADKSVSFDIPRSENWAEPVVTEIGEIKIDGPGVYHLILRPANPENWKAVNVWQIQLAPKV